MKSGLFTLLIAGLVLVQLPCGSLLGQSDLPGEDRATMMFDMNVKGLRESEIMKSFGFDRLMDLMMISEDTIGMDPSSVDRWVALFCWPDDPRLITDAVPEGEFPVSFVWQVDLNQPAPGVAEFFESDRFEPVEVNGKKYFKPGDVTNVLFHYSGNRLLVCSQNYLNQELDDLMSDGLKDALGQLPDDQPIKVAVDVKKSRKFLEELCKLQDPELWTMGLDGTLLYPVRLHEHLDQVAISIGLDGQLVTGFALSADEASAQTFFDELTQMASVGRLGAAMLLSEAGMKSRAAQKQVDDFFKQLKPQRDELTLRIAVDQPDGFKKFMTDLVDQLERQATEAKKLNRFREVGASVFNFHAENNEFPFHNSENDGFHENLSWRVKTTPFLWHAHVEEIRSDEPWDSENNKPFATQMPEAYGNGNELSDMCWIKSKVKKRADVHDGLSRTIMLLEYPEGVTWTKPKDISVLEAMRLVKDLKDGESLIALMYNSSTRRIDNTISQSKLKRLLLPADESEDFEEKK